MQRVNFAAELSPSELTSKCYFTGPCHWNGTFLQYGIQRPPGYSRLCTSRGRACHRPTVKFRSVSSDPQFLTGALPDWHRLAAPSMYSSVCTLPLAHCALKPSPLALLLIMELTVSAQRKALIMDKLQKYVAHSSCTHSLRLTTFKTILRRFFFFTLSTLF